MNNPFIEFDISKIQELKGIYETVMNNIQTDYPEINLNSNKQIVTFLKQDLAIPAENARIKHLEQFLCNFDENSLDFLTLYGITTYLKLKYSIRNYLNCILRQQEDGRVYLRYVDGEWKMPNKQPISGNPEITECEKVRSDGI